MEAKLTLQMDSSVISSMKNYSKTVGKSISKIAEDFFRTLAVPTDEPVKTTALVKELSGIISEKDLEGLNYTDYLEKKYE